MDYLVQKRIDENIAKIANQIHTIPTESKLMQNLILDHPDRLSDYGQWASYYEQINGVPPPPSKKSFIQRTSGHVPTILIAAVTSGIIIAAVKVIA